MKMEFIFNKEKLKQNGYTEEQCFNIIRKHFEKYNKKGTIKEIRQGFFVGTEDDWSAFATTAKFPYYEWFLRFIDKWYWYIDEGDGLGEQKGDCLKAYYEVRQING